MWIEKCDKIMQEVNKVVIGKPEVVKNIMVSIIAGGHVLLEDVPGVGKTTIAMAFSKAMRLSYGRVQFTPDVMPSDVIGFSIFNREKGEFEYRQGAINCNFFLADEINRASSKTQSALLEAMEEKKVTVDGKTYELEKPFIVMATQNPVGSIGTAMLPESQVDRFMMKLSVGYPDFAGEIAMLKTKEKGNNALNDVQVIADAGDLLQIQKLVSETFVHDDIYAYVVNIVNATRNNQNISLGVSPRGTVAIINAAKAQAFLCRRNYVIPDDVKNVLYSVINHRIILSQKARVASLDMKTVINSIIASIPVGN